MGTDMQSERALKQVIRRVEGVGQVDMQRLVRSVNSGAVCQWEESTGFRGKERTLQI